MTSDNNLNTHYSKEGRVTMSKNFKKRLAARLRAKGEDDTFLWSTPTKRRTEPVKPSSNFYPFTRKQSKS